MLSIDAVGGAEASKNGFSNSIPDTIVFNVDIYLIHKFTKSYILFNHFISCAFIKNLVFKHR